MKCYKNHFKCVCCCCHIKKLHATFTSVYYFFSGQFNLFIYTNVKNALNLTFKVGSS